MMLDPFDPPHPQGGALRGADAASAAIIPISTGWRRRGWKCDRGGRPLRRGRLAQGAQVGSRHGPARRRLPHRQDDPDLRARRAAAFRRHQHVPQGALCRERQGRRQVRRRRDRHPVRLGDDLPARHAVRAAGHPPHLGALHAVQLRAWRRPARADDAVRRWRRVHHSGEPREKLRPQISAAASPTSSRPARCR